MRSPPSSMSWIAMQALLQARVSASERNAAPRPPLNPKPPGRFCDGGAAEAVLGWLLQRRSDAAWWSMNQLIAGTGRSAKACSWAVIFLARHGYIERERDVTNSRYLRYRASASARELFLQKGKA